MSVEVEGSAERVGVLLGNILLTLEEVGQPIKAQIIRGGQLIELTLTIGERW